MHHRNLLIQVLELLYYLKEMESDITKRSVAIPGPVMKRIIIPEV